MAASKRVAKARRISVVTASSRIAKAQVRRPEATSTLARAYRKTTYAADIDGVRHAIRVGRRHRPLDVQLQLLGTTTWAGITAWNPQSQPLSSRENKHRHALLAQALHDRRVRWHPLRATGDAGNWPAEEGVLALGITRASARSLGRKFGQLAVVWGRVGEKAELVWC